MERGMERGKEGGKMDGGTEGGMENLLPLPPPPMAGLPDLEKVVIFPFCGTKDIDITGIPNWSV